MEEWVPVMSIGVVLLYPRIMEYDVAPVTLFLAIVVWRTFSQNNTQWRNALEMALSLPG